MPGKYHDFWSGSFGYWSGKNQGKVREFYFPKFVETLIKETENLIIIFSV